MLIPITFNPPPSSPQPTDTPKLPSSLARISNDEVVLIELQGKLEVEGAQSSDKNGKFVGKLTIGEDGSKPTLLIGHHLLEGKIASLTKPLAILTRSTADVDSATAPLPSRSEARCDEGSNGIEHSPAAPSSQIQWEAVGIVKRKIVFAKRPMPVVGRPS